MTTHSPPARTPRSPVVAAFDFDGTLSTRDNLLPFLVRVADAAGVARALVASSIEAGIGGPRAWRRDALKAGVLRRLFAGFDADELDRIGRAFAFEIMRRHLRPEAVDRVDWHRTQGHRLVVVTASLGAYVRPVAERLRFDAVLATELEVGPDGVLTGALGGANVRGAEKARRLQEWLGRRFVDQRPFVWAYGDSGGDRHLLAYADRPVRVGRRRFAPIEAGADAPPIPAPP